MPVGATIGAVGSIGGSLIGSSAASKAADTQAAAAQQALQFQQNVFDYQKEQFNTVKSNLNPFIGFGTNAMSSLADLYGLSGKGAQGTNDAFTAFQNLPAYQFPFQQGNRALNLSLNAQGRQLSGAQAKGAQQFGQGLASTYLMSNYVNPLLQFTQIGQGAAGSLAQASNQNSATLGNTANNIGNTYQGIGQAQAAGTVGSANALSSGLTGAAGNLAAYSYLNKFGNNNSSASNSNSSYTFPNNIGEPSQYNPIS